MILYIWNEDINNVVNDSCDNSYYKHNYWTLWFTIRLCDSIM